MYRQQKQRPQGNMCDIKCLQDLQWNSFNPLNLKFFGRIWDVWHFILAPVRSYSSWSSRAIFRVFTHGGRSKTFNSSPEQCALLAPQVCGRKNKSSSRQETVTSWHVDLSESAGFEAICSVFHGKEIKSAQWVRLKQTFLQRVGQKMSQSQTSSWASAEWSGLTVTSQARGNVSQICRIYCTWKETKGNDWTLENLPPVTFKPDQSGFFSTSAASW